MSKRLERLAILLACIAAPLVWMLVRPRAAPVALTSRCSVVQLVGVVSASARPAPSEAAPISTATMTGEGTLSGGSTGACGGVPNHYAGPAWETHSLGPFHLRHESPRGCLYSFGETHDMLWVNPACPGGAITLPRQGELCTAPSELAVRSLAENEFLVSWRDWESWLGVRVGIVPSTMTLWPRAHQATSRLPAIGVAWSIGLVLSRRLGELAPRGAVSYPSHRRQPGGDTMTIAQTQPLRGDGSRGRVEMAKTCSLETLGRLTEALTVEEIAGLSDDTLRNYLITYSYYLLDIRMRPHLGQNLSWAGFGSWASELAGRCIRGEQVPFRGLMPAAIVARVSSLVAKGNQWVYAEIAPAFRNFADYMDQVSERERAQLSTLASRGGTELRDFVKTTLRLDPRSAAEGGQGLLCAAFTQYLIAAHESDPDARAERVFVANVAIGLHEQRRLDPMIDEMLSFPMLNRAAEVAFSPLFALADLTRPARVKAFSLGDTMLARRAVDRFPSLSQLAEVSRDAREFLRQVRAHRLTYAFSTRFVLALPLGDDVLALGKDVTPRSDGAMFPEHLRVFDTTDVQLRALLDDALAWDRTPDTLSGSAANDWSSLGDRMNFILDLFRSRQQDPALFANPLLKAAR